MKNELEEGELANKTQNGSLKIPTEPVNSQPIEEPM